MGMLVCKLTMQEVRESILMHNFARHFRVGTKLVQGHIKGGVCFPERGEDSIENNGKIVVFLCWQVYCFCNGNCEYRIS